MRQPANRLSWDYLKQNVLFFLEQAELICRAAFCFSACLIYKNSISVLLVLLKSPLQSLGVILNQKSQYEIPGWRVPTATELRISRRPTALMFVVTMESSPNSSENCIAPKRTAINFEPPSRPLIVDYLVHSVNSANERFRVFRWKFGNVYGYKDT